MPAAFRCRTRAGTIAHRAWLDDGDCREELAASTEFGKAIHGRGDLPGPVLLAWKLAQARPDAELTIIEDFDRRSPAIRTAISMPSPSLTTHPHRKVGRQVGRRHRSAMGYAYLHHAVDDRSRLAYSEILGDETTESAAAFWLRASAFFASHSITVLRVLTDIGS
jgi:hypothetical protein